MDEERDNNDRQRQTDTDKYGWVNRRMTDRESDTDRQTDKDG